MNPILLLVCFALNCRFPQKPVESKFSVQQIYYSEFGVWHQAEKKIVAALVSCYTITIIVWLQIVSTAWKL